MPINNPLLTTFDYAFITMPPTATVNDALAALWESGQNPVQAFLAVESPAGYIRFDELNEYLQKTGDTAAPVTALPLQKPDRIIEDLQAVNPFELQKWLNNTPFAVVFILQAGKLAHILYATDLSGGTATDSILEMHRAGTLTTLEPPTCPHCGAQNFFTYQPSMEAYICPTCNRVTLPPPSEDRDEVKFTSRFPREALTKQEYSIHLYAHTPDMTNKVIETLEEQENMGKHPSRPRTTHKPTTLQRGTIIRVRLELEEKDNAPHITISPPAIERVWNGNPLHFAFKIQINEVLANTTINLRLSIQVGGIEIAKQLCQIEVLPTSESVSSFPPPHEWSTVDMYDKIFISYSRKDKHIVQMYWKAQKAAGNEVFLDTEEIRAGECWRERLAKAILESDYMQLFWSENSKASKNVEDEWQYAIEQKCTADACRSFIRPVYWQKPIPKVPHELRHLHFRYEPFEEDKPDTDKT